MNAKIRGISQIERRQRVCPVLHASDVQVPRFIKAPQRIT